MGPGSEILMQLEKHHQPTPTGCGNNSSVVKNNKNSNSHQPKNNRKSDKKAANVHDEAKKSTAATTAATATTPNTNNRENKKKSAKTAKSNLTSSYPPYNAKSKPIPVKRSNSQDAGGVLSLQNHVMKAPKNFVNANPASRYSPVKGGPITPSTRPSSWTPTNLQCQSQSPGKVFYAGAKFEAHPTTSAGLPTPPPHWTTLASATPQLRSHSQPSTPTINDKCGQSPAIDLASLFGSLNASINKPSSTPVAKSFQGETSIGQKRNQAESESSDEEMKEIFSDGEKKKVVSKKEVVPSVIVQGVVTPKKEQPRSILDNTCQGSVVQLGSLKEMSDQLKSLMKVAA